MATSPAELGQHFLVDGRVIARVVEAAHIVPGETVLDAGAGAGAITRPLANAVGAAGRVLAVEVDPDLHAALAREVPAHVSVVAEDLLTMRWLPVDAVVANPPFKIAAPLVERIVAAKVPRSVLVLPRELIDRLVALPGNERYGKLTVRVQLRATVEDLGLVSRHAFDPPPMVACGILRFVARPETVTIDPAMLDRVLDVARDGWDRRAKHAFNKLATAMGADSAALTRLLRDGGWAERRTGDLPPEAFAAVARHLHDVASA